jgi:23S rRNA (cytosine1962-C5)-methyltransferase
MKKIEKKKFVKKTINKTIVSSISAHYLIKGHPWITKDQWTEKFPTESFLLNIYSENSDNRLGIFLHDPTHPLVKARFWKKPLPHIHYSLTDFKNDFLERIILSCQKRMKMKDSQVSDSLKRENYYLIFSEIDLLPGLYVLKLKDNIIIQTHFPYDIDLIVKSLIEAFKIIFPNPSLPLSFWHQMRTKNAPFRFIPTEKNKKVITNKFVIEEFKINYLIKLNSFDLGLYTDMSSVRKKLLMFFEKNSINSTHKFEKTLNLFSYTGAFSLNLATVSKEVVSVDLSASNLEWFQENLNLNPHLNEIGQHKIIQGASEKVIEEYKLNKTKFDFIICDPPPIISIKMKGPQKNNKIKKVNSLKFYELYLKDLFSLVKPQGFILIFHNGHNVTRNKFQKLVTDQLDKSVIKHTIKENFHLDQDCPTLKTFPEGDYLKGILFQKL